MTCRFCYCTELTPCVIDHPVTGEPIACSWAIPNVCSFCAEQDPFAEFVLKANFIHRVVWNGVPDYTPEQRRDAAELYKRAAAQVVM